MATTVITAAQAASSTTVQGIITAAAVGDILIMPVGTFTWTTSVTISKGITFIGGGTGNVMWSLGSNLQGISGGGALALTGGTIIQNNCTGGANMLSLSPPTTGANFLKVSQIAFTDGGTDGGNGNCVEIGGGGGTTVALIQSCYFENKGGVNHAVNWQMNGGVMWNCTFFGHDGTAGIMNFAQDTSNPGTSWQSLSTMGNLDTTGLLNTYIEGCTFTAMGGGGGGGQALDLDSNSRVVIRHCNFYNAVSSSHGQDTSVNGMRHYEIYNNTWLNQATGTSPNGGGAYPLNLAWGWLLRGGTGVIYNNAMNSFSNSAWGAKVCWDFGSFNIQIQPNAVGCQTVYPAARQPGQTWVGNTTQNGTLNGTTTITGLPVTYPKIAIGQTVTGAGIPGGTKVSSIVSTSSITISQAATTSGTSSLTFTGYSFPSPIAPVAATVDGTGYGTDPVFLWNNTYSQNAGQNPAVQIGTQNQSDACGNGQSFAPTYWQSGRDFIDNSATNNAKPGYVAFTYPHPLTQSAIVINGNYSSSFAAPPAPENPVSENGAWNNGGSAGWTNCRTSSGLIFGTQPGNASGNAEFADSTAIVTGTWGTEQTAQATIFYSGTSNATGIFEEVELRLRTTIGSTTITGYECNCSVNQGSASGLYMQVVKWNGNLGSFSELDGRTIPAFPSGSILKASITGGTGTATITHTLLASNGTTVLFSFTVTDPSPFITGNPGVGFYLQGTTGLNANYGFSNFSATSGATGPTFVSGTVRIL